MNDTKFIITEKMYRGDSMIVSTRLPNDLVKDLDGIAKQTGRTRNEIIQLSLEFAIKNLEIKSVKKD